jgi:hypothetical protein
MNKAAINPATGNTINFRGGEWEYEQACDNDSAAQSEYAYEQEMLAKGIDPWTGDSIKTIKMEKGWVAA